MNDFATPIERFFHSFEQSSDSGDFSALIPQFADVFLAAGPGKAQSVKARDFALALPGRRQLFESLGCQATALVSLQENRLDDRYALVSTRWRMTFARESDDPQEVLADSTFLVDTSTEDFKIVLYLAHRDPMAMLREKGILPS